MNAKKQVQLFFYRTTSLQDLSSKKPTSGTTNVRYYYIASALQQTMQLHTGAEHFGNVIKRGIAKRGCS